jgi:hypothetical protein
MDDRQLGVTALLRLNLPGDTTLRLGGELLVVQAGHVWTSFRGLDSSTVLSVHSVLRSADQLRTDDPTANVDFSICVPKKYCATICGFVIASHTRSGDALIKIWYTWVVWTPIMLFPSPLVGP